VCVFTSLLQPPFANGGARSRSSSSSQTLAAHKAALNFMLQTQRAAWIINYE
jgi:hypothetical protein